MCRWIISIVAQTSHGASCMIKGKNIQNQELREFIEMCFDPQAPVNKRLKEALFRIMEEGQEKT